jgi:hypothetical protein
MRRPDLTKDKAGMRAGDVGKAAIQGELNKANPTPHCPVEIAQRRAASIRLQAIGQIGGAL